MILGNGGRRTLAISPEEAGGNRYRPVIRRTVANDDAKAEFIDTLLNTRRAQTILNDLRELRARLEERKHHAKR